MQLWATDVLQLMVSETLILEMSSLMSNVSVVSNNSSRRIKNMHRIIDFFKVDIRPCKLIGWNNFTANRAFAPMGNRSVGNQL